MFNLFKKNKKIKSSDYIPTSSELDNIERLKEKLGILKATYDLLNRRVYTIIMQNPKDVQSANNISKTLDFFNYEVVNLIRYMSDNNVNKIYSEIIIEFKKISDRVDSLKADLEKYINSEYINIEKMPQGE